jgi:ribosomal protein S12 methylthiotransferase accessory factor
MTTNTGSAEHLLELVSPKVGVIRSLSPVARGAEEPDPPAIYQAMLAHFDFRRAKSWERVAVGKALNERDAMLGAIGEAIEHYCASHFDVYATRRSPWTEVLPDALAPTECVLYSERQYARRDFPYRRWDPRDEVRWLPMTELPGRQSVFAPATIVYMSLLEVQAQDLFCAPTSNGLAAGPNLEFAVLHGLCELIERDSFLITWMNRLPAAEVDFSGGPGLALSIREHYARFGVQIHVYNVSTDLPAYVMMGLLVDRTGRGPAGLVGLGCDLNPGVAITKALLEVCQVRPGEVQRYQRERPAERLKSYEDVRTLEDHSAFFHPLERLAEFSFLLENGCTVQLRDLPDHSRGSVTADLAMCITALTESGSRVLYADLTTPDVAPYGFRVVRTIATGLQPMHFGFGEERLGGRRLYEIPKVVGYFPEIRGEDDLNPCPHPLA